MNLPYRIRKIYDSALFQGSSFRKGYFEGWYFKLTTPDSARGEAESFAVIPGISVSDAGVRHAFIQSIDGRTGRTRYTEYPIEAFSFSKHDFSIRVGESHFSRNGVALHIHEGDHDLDGEVRFIDITDIPRTIISPTIMGWYRYVPRMECCHGVVSVDHGLSGSLIIDGGKIGFDGGRGYIEKDYGVSFPSSWIWIQTNRFELSGVSFMLSIARIPWFGRSFVGLLGFLKTPDGFYRFATYVGTRIVNLSVDEDSVSIILEGNFGAGAKGDPKTTSTPDRLTIRAIKGKPGGLKAPVRGAMQRIITESVTATVEIEMTGSHAFRGVGTVGGLEIAGNHLELFEGVAGKRDNIADADVT